MKEFNFKYYKVIKYSLFNIVLIYLYIFDLLWSNNLTNYSIAQLYKQLVLIIVKININNQDKNIRFFSVLI